MMLTHILTGFIVVLLLGVMGLVVAPRRHAELRREEMAAPRRPW